MEENNDVLSEQVTNALTELGNIGAGNAATSLSMMLSSKLTMTTPEVKLYDFNSLENILGGPDATVVGVMSGIEGDLTAIMLFVIGIEDAAHLVGVLMGTELEWHSEVGLSAVSEIANIIMGSYVSSLETLSGLKIRHGMPDICIDMAGSILSVPCIEFGKVSDKTLLINSRFMVGDKAVNGYIMVVSEPHSYDKLLRRLGIGGSNE